MEVKNNESIEMLEETTKVKKKHVTFVEPSLNRNNNNNNTSYKRFVYYK